jgi:hypothetical protein
LAQARVERESKRADGDAENKVGGARHRENVPEALKQKRPLRSELRRGRGWVYPLSGRW